MLNYVNKAENTSELAEVKIEKKPLIENLMYYLNKKVFKKLIPEMEGCWPGKGESYQHQKCMTTSKYWMRLSMVS